MKNIYLCNIQTNVLVQFDYFLGQSCGLYVKNADMIISNIPCMCEINGWTEDKDSSSCRGSVGAT